MLFKGACFPISASVCDGHLQPHRYPGKMCSAGGRDDAIPCLSAGTQCIPGQKEVPTGTESCLTRALARFCCDPVSMGYASRTGCGTAVQGGASVLISILSGIICMYLIVINTDYNSMLSSLKSHGTLK